MNSQLRIHRSSYAVALRNNGRAIICVYMCSGAVSLFVGFAETFCGYRFSYADCLIFVENLSNWLNRVLYFVEIWFKFG